MPLYIRDDEVDALAEKLKAVTGASSKTEAVKRALREAVKRSQAEVPVLERIKKVQERARKELGLPNPDFDFRKFREELWGDND